MAQAQNQLVPLSETKQALTRDFCSRCKAKVIDAGDFCHRCGTSLISSHATAIEPVVLPPSQPVTTIPQDVSPGFGRMTQMFGLHPLVTFGVLGVDWMLFGQEAATFFVGWLISIPIAVVLGVGSALCQRHLYGDEWGGAIGKSVIIALLTAIPTSLSTFLLLPSGAVGALRSFRQMTSKK